MLVNKGTHLTEAQKLNLRQKNLGKTLSAETRRKIGVANSVRGQGPQARRKLSEARRGKPLSAEHREKLSLSHMGKTQTREFVEKRISGLRGRKRPPEVGRKIAATKALYPQTGRVLYSKPHRLFVQLFENRWGVGLELEFRLVTDSGHNRYYDCYLPGWSILFEIDGNYWHSRPEQVERDAEKTQLAERLGYTLYRIPEDKVIEFVSAFRLPTLQETYGLKQEQPTALADDQAGLGAGGANVNRNGRPGQRDDQGDSNRDPSGEVVQG
jgi:hypothetical protein